MATAVEKLIEEIEKRPVIWDTKHHEYNMSDKRKAAWCEVSSILMPNFNKETETVQKCIIQEMIIKWRNIRDNYIKLKRRQLQNGALFLSKECMYQEQLVFLNKIIEYSNTVINKQNNSTKPNKVLNHEDNRESISSVQPQQNLSMSVPFEFIKSNNNESNDTIKHNKLLVDTPTDHHDIEFDSSSTTEQPTSNLIITSVCTETNVADNNNEVDEDEDLAFFYSLLPFVKSLSISQRKEFRKQITQLAQNIKTNYTNPQDYLVTPAIHLHLPTNPAAYSHTPSHREETRNTTSNIKS